MINEQPLFIRACRGESTNRIPIWIMRQAGRYLPEYRTLRSRVSFLDLCRTPELAMEATLQPIQRYDFDAAIIFSDILIPLDPMGLDMRFDDRGPIIMSPVRTRADVDRLRPLNTASDLPFLPESIRLVTQELGDVPLIGFCGAPFTLACYAVEGRTSKDFTRIKSLLYSDPHVAHALLRQLTDAVVDSITAQLDAGARVFQIFDTWGGLLSASDYRSFSLPYLSVVFDRLRGRGAPGILYVKGAAHLLDVIYEAGPDVVGIDWRTGFAEARERLPRCVLMGNLDPAVLFSSEETLRDRVSNTLREGAEGGAYVFNLGHGILPDTPVENVETLVETVRSFSRNGTEPPRADSSTNRTRPEPTS